MQDDNHPLMRWARKQRKKRGGKKFMSLLEDLKRDEGLRLKMYKDIKEIWSIGYGLNLEEGITKEEAEYLLQNRIDISIHETNIAFPWMIRLNETRKNVFYNMAYNMGVPRLKGFIKALAAAKAGDYDTAAEEILDSKAARDLPVRYNRLANNMRGS